MVTPEFCPEKSSATSELMGWTVEDPETTTLPVNPEAELLVPPHAAPMRAMAAVREMAPKKRANLCMEPPFPDFRGRCPNPFLGRGFEARGVREASNPLPGKPPVGWRRLLGLGGEPTTAKLSR